MGAAFYMLLLVLHWLRGCWLSVMQLHAYRNRPALYVGWVIFVLSLGEVFFIGWGKICKTVVDLWLLGFFIRYKPALGYICIELR